MPDSSSAQNDDFAAFDRLSGAFQSVKQQLASVIFGQDEVIDEVLVSLLAGGHNLLVGAPGLAKTKLVTTLGTLMGLETKRVQFTPDLMPTDILGTEILDEAVDGKRSFRFIEGPVFSQLLMADEINRASPRTQSALLEAMQEQQVTVAGARRKLPQPFHVLATQNPIEQEGTYPLPEAQLDRFLLQTLIDYPDLESERDMLAATTGADEAALEAVTSSDDLLEAQKLIRAMPIGEGLIDEILTLVRALRPEGSHATALVWGPGPRASQALSLACRARAFLDGRTAPGRPDLRALAPAALRHRMALSFASRAEGQTVETVIGSLLEKME